MRQCEGQFTVAEMKQQWHNLLTNCKTSAIRQKGKSQNGCFEKTKDAKFSEKRTFFYPLIRIHVAVSGGKKMFVFRKIWRALFSWNTRFEIRPFALLLTKREKKREESSKSSGSGSSEVYTSSWPYYHLMSFTENTYEMDESQNYPASSVILEK